MSHPDSERKPDYKEVVLSGKIAMVTGASRDIGAGIAKELAREGALVFGTFNNKKRRAEEVAAEIESQGGRIIFAQGDITQEETRGATRAQFDEACGHSPLHALVLNTSGEGREINVIAANRLVDLFLPAMKPGGKIVLMNSAPAYLLAGGHIEAGDIPEFYASVAEAKAEGERTLRARMGEFQDQGVTFYSVVAPWVDGTSNVRLFERVAPGIKDTYAELSTRFNLPGTASIEQVASRVTQLISSNQPSGYTELFMDMMSNE